MTPVDVAVSCLRFSCIACLKSPDLWLGNFTVLASVRAVQGIKFTRGPEFSMGCLVLNSTLRISIAVARCYIHSQGLATAIDK